MTKSKRYIQLRGAIAGIRKAKKDLPKERLVSVDLETGVIILTEDKHSLHLKVAKDFNLRVTYIKELV